MDETASCQCILKKVVTLVMSDLSSPNFLSSLFSECNVSFACVLSIVQIAYKHYLSFVLQIGKRTTALRETSVLKLKC